MAVVFFSAQTQHRQVHQDRVRRQHAERMGRKWRAARKLPFSADLLRECVCAEFLYYEMLQPARMHRSNIIRQKSYRWSAIAVVREFGRGGSVHTRVPTSKVKDGLFRFLSLCYSKRQFLTALDTDLGTMLGSRQPAMHDSRTALLSPTALAHNSQRGFSGHRRTRTRQGPV